MGILFLESNSFNPYYNLGLEKYLFDNNHKDIQISFLHIQHQQNTANAIILHLRNVFLYGILKKI